MLLAGVTTVPPSMATELTLHDVEQLALADDPAVRSVEAQRLALQRNNFV